MVFYDARTHSRVAWQRSLRDVLVVLPAGRLRIKVLMLGWLLAATVTDPEVAYTLRLHAIGYDTSLSSQQKIAEYQKLLSQYPQQKLFVFLCDESRFHPEVPPCGALSGS